MKAWSLNFFHPSFTSSLTGINIHLKTPNSKHCYPILVLHKKPLFKRKISFTCWSLSSFKDGVKQTLFSAQLTFFFLNWALNNCYDGRDVIVGTLTGTGCTTKESLFDSRQVRDLPPKHLLWLWVPPSFQCMCIWRHFPKRKAAVAWS